MKANLNGNHFTLISLLNKRQIDNMRFELISFQKEKNL